MEDLNGVHAREDGFVLHQDRALGRRRERLPQPIQDLQYCDLVQPTIAYPMIYHKVERGHDTRCQS